MAEGFPAIKWFSEQDATADYPMPVRCYRVDKEVNGFSFSDWASWYKLTKFLRDFPIPF